jgi:hypothetical protein
MVAAYCTVKEVDSYANSNGYTDWRKLTNDQKLNAISKAVDDIEEQHGQDKVNYTLWNIGNYWLNQANIKQAIYRGINEPEFISKEKTAIETGGSLSKGSISVERNEKTMFGDGVISLINQALDEAGIIPGLLGRN